MKPGEKLVKESKHLQYLNHTSKVTAKESKFGCYRNTKLPNTKTRVLKFNIDVFLFAIGEHPLHF